jgi:two-component system phosphate regulon sensor histidine kinase PhoR
MADWRSYTNSTFVTLIMQRNNISVLFMLLTILAVLAFQCYWLYKNYKEEKQTLSLHTNILFRQTIDQLQIERLQLDSTIKWRSSEKYGVIKMRDAVGRMIRDTIIERRRIGPNVRFRVDHRQVGVRSGEVSDSTKHEIYNITVPDEEKFVTIIRKADSLQDSLPVKDIQRRYAKLLEREGLNVPFTIIASHEIRLEEMPPIFESANEITIGLKKPITYKLQLGSRTAYLLKQLSTEIIVSLLLIGVTIFSFWLLYSNLRKQQRLTQIKNEFISNITHELKTPIATVSVAIEALQSFNAMQNPERTKEYLDISSNELQRLSLLVDKVLKLSMFEKQQVELKPELFDLKRLVAEVVGSMRPQFVKYNATVDLKSEGNDFSINADRLHITSVLFNLLDNAMKYSEAAPSVIIEVNEAANSIELSVRDSGIGIPPEFKTKIFEKFFRVPSGNTHNVKGYGLGLSYVMYVIQRHKGSIEVTSKPGVGTSFTINLPKQNG